MGIRFRLSIRMDSVVVLELETLNSISRTTFCAHPWSNSRTQKLTTVITASRIRYVKKHVADLPLVVVLHAAKSATQRAAVDAVKAGRVVTGWKDGKLVEYGPGAFPLVPTNHDEVTSDVHVTISSQP